MTEKFNAADESNNFIKNEISKNTTAVDVPHDLTHADSANTSAVTGNYIRVRTEFEGFHYYPGAANIDPRIAFLEKEHRHLFKVAVKISVTHLDRELEFFLVKWALQDFVKDGRMNHKSCEMIAHDILQNHLIPKYGPHRLYEVVVSEDGENDGIVEYFPIKHCCDDQKSWMMK